MAIMGPLIHAQGKKEQKSTANEIVLPISRKLIVYWESSLSPRHYLLLSAVSGCAETHKARLCALTFSDCVEEKKRPQGSSTHGKSCSWPWVAFKATTAGRALYANGSILSEGRVRGAFCCLAWTAAPATSQGAGAPQLCDQPVGTTSNIRHP